MHRRVVSGVTTSKFQAARSLNGPFTPPNVSYKESTAVFTQIALNNGTIMSKRILISDGNDQKEEIIQATSSLSGWTN